jgi:hypothetical protein
MCVPARTKWKPSSIEQMSIQTAMTSGTRNLMREPRETVARAWMAVGGQVRCVPGKDSPALRDWPREGAYR